MKNKYTLIIIAILFVHWHVSAQDQENKPSKWEYGIGFGTNLSQNYLKTDENVGNIFRPHAGINIFGDISYNLNDRFSIITCQVSQEKR